MRFISEGKDAKVVMVGAARGAKQAWPAVSSVESAITLSTAADLEKLPYQGFDGRTNASSKLVPGIVFGNQFAPQANVSPTYEFRLMDRIFDGAFLSIETTIPAAPKSLASPSMLVLSATTDGTNEVIGVEYGSGGVRIVSLLGATVRHEYSIPYSIYGGVKLRVERFLSWIQVFVNNISIGAATHPTFTLKGAPGIGAFSSAAPNMSTPVGTIAVSGGTSLAKLDGGKGFVAVGSVAQQGKNVTILSFTVPGGRSMKAVTRNMRWNVNGNYNRGFALMLNGTIIGYLGGFDGTDYVVSSAFSVPEHSVISVVTFVNAVNAPEEYRTVKSGSVEILPA